ncbi:hypothetical protein [Pseudonocardia sp. DLS-67]
MIDVADPEVQCSPGLFGFVVVADVAAEEVVGQQQVAGAYAVVRPGGTLPAFSEYSAGRVSCRQLVPKPDTR